MWQFAFAFCGNLLLIFVAFRFGFLWHFTFAFCANYLIRAQKKEPHITMRFPWSLKEVYIYQKWN